MKSTSEYPQAEAVRADFPVLSRRVLGDNPLTYLDNAATAQKPQVVIDAVSDYYTRYNANVHRGMHTLAEEATSAYEAARVKVANFIHAAAPREIIFTRGTTESINLLAHAWGRKFAGEGDEIILTQMEHHSNLVPWQLLAQQTGVTLRYVPVDPASGMLDLEAYSALLNSRTRLVAFTHISNALGTINPVKQIIALARKAGARVMLDGAQSVPHLPVDVQELDVDFLAFSGHKLCAPTGIGVLYGRESLLEDMDPFLAGGEMIDRVTLEGSTWADLPYKFEAGTPNMAGAIGLGVAVDYLQGLGMDWVHSRVHELTDYALAQLSTLEGLRLHGTPPERGGAVSFSLKDLHPHDIAQCVDQEGVAIRAGHLCCQPLMDALGVPAVARASMYFYNTTEEIDRLRAALQSTLKVFGYA